MRTQYGGQIIINIVEHASDSAIGVTTIQYVRNGVQIGEIEDWPIQLALSKALQQWAWEISKEQ